MSVPMRPGDPAYWMLERGRRDPSWRSEKEVHRDGCYICEDEEFELMGLPLCKACPRCSEKAEELAGHIPADDITCDDCGFDIQEAFVREQQQKTELADDIDDQLSRES